MKTTMRIAIWAFVYVACNSSKPRDESVPVVVAAPQVKAVNAIAAWIPLLDRKDGLYERRLALAARHEIAALAKASGNPELDDLSQTAMLQRTISKAVLCLPLPIHEDTDSHCHDAIKALRTHLAETQLLTLDKPDPAAKEHADAMIAGRAGAESEGVERRQGGRDSRPGHVRRDLRRGRGRVESEVRQRQGVWCARQLLRLHRWLPRVSGDQDCRAPREDPTETDST